MIIENYPQNQGLHCETGSIKNLLDFNGCKISEEMIFGIGSGLDFILFPFRTFEGTEAPLLRNTPGKVFSNFTKRMGIECEVRKFFNADKSMAALDELLNKGIPAGIVTEVHYLPFFPLNNFFFPAHTIVAIGKEGNEYTVSDIDYHFPDASFHKIMYDDLKKARNPKGMFSPRGKLFHIKYVPKEMDFKKGIIQGIKDTCYQMLDIPIPFFGVKGIYYYSKRLRLYTKKYTEAEILKNHYRYFLMAEESGTGGSGYRYMYTVFLKEAAEIFKDDELLALSSYMREVGDRWKVLSLEVLRQTKDRKAIDLDTLADITYSIAQMEEKAFTDLRKWVKKQ